MKARPGISRVPASYSKSYDLPNSICKDSPKDNFWSTGCAYSGGVSMAGMPSGRP